MSSRITHHLRAYLADQGSLFLPGFGVISYDGSQIAEAVPETNEGFPPGTLSFQAETGVAWDEGLIASIANETGKMRTLVVSDLDSFLQFGHELTNISKPFHIEGIGWLQKDHRGNVSFMQEDGAPVTTGGRSRKGRAGSDGKGIELPWRAMLPWAGILLLAGGAVWAAVHFDWAGQLGRWREARRAADTAANTPAPVLVDSVDTSASKAKAEAYPFSVVLEVSSRERALKRYADLKEWGHDVRMTTRDSVKFKLFIPIQAPLSDTARHRDSLRIFFNRRVWIETHPDE